MGFLVAFLILSYLLMFGKRLVLPIMPLLDWKAIKVLLIVMSGIENANYKQALDIIKEQFAAMKQGDFTEEELQQTKAVVKNQFLETIDVSRGLVEILYHNVIAKATIITR